MGIGLLMLILSSVVLSSVVQLAMKKGMSNDSIQGALASGDVFDTVLVIAANPYVLGGLCMYGLGAAVWLLVLAKVDLTFAYPFIGLAFVLTAVLGWLFLDESLGPARILGTASVVFGVLLISTS